jgi:hypothetical protein
MTVREFTVFMENLSDRYPDYEVVICNCIECRAAGNPRENNWAVNHAERKVYL